ncbi:MAG: DNA primase [Candidatus Gygaella obscura]|nr:DNA primase [Candidatus Gygaella obscura]
MSNIPDNILDDILSKIDIVELISGYLPLKRAGRNFRANCPFHAEKTPSFMVSPERQIYHCFGCGAGGNAISFLMKHERMDFPDAVDTLARTAGVVIPRSQGFLKAENIRERLFRINELAVSFFQKNLLNGSNRTKPAVEYLKKRGITLETVKKFKLGYSSDGWDALIKYLSSKGISISLIEKAGLAIAKTTGGYYDRFRNRLMIPISDIRSRIVGFGARVLDNSLPKYINSPESAIYTKGQHLYGLDIAKQSIKDKDQALVVEGYMDFLACFCAGIENVVASLGTALTVSQIKILRRFTNNIIVVFDSDEAGQMASMRSLDLFIEQDIPAKVVSLEKGFDPDSFIKKRGIKEFQKHITDALSIYEFKLMFLRNSYKENDIHSKAKIANEMLLSISKFQNNILISEYVRKLAEDIGIKEESLLLELKKIKNKNIVSKPEFDRIDSIINPKEFLILKLLLLDEQLLNKYVALVHGCRFSDVKIKKIIDKVYDFFQEGKKINTSLLLNCFIEDASSDIICRAVSDNNDIPEDREKILMDCVERIKGDNLKSKRFELEERIRNAERTKNKKELDSLLQEFLTLTKKDG